jgi:hypothetical protein
MNPGLYASANVVGSKMYIVGGSFAPTQVLTLTLGTAALSVSSTTDPYTNAFSVSTKYADVDTAVLQYPVHMSGTNYVSLATRSVLTYGASQTLTSDQGANACARAHSLSPVTANVFVVGGSRQQTLRGAMTVDANDRAVLAPFVSAVAMHPATSLSKSACLVLFGRLVLAGGSDPVMSANKAEKTVSTIIL